MKICDDLRQAVLQAAIQGKLTTQRKEDGDARELLKQIAEEKAKLIKDKKIKKEKPLPEIIEDEIPFDVPENWVWCRLGYISTYNQPKQKVNAEQADSDIWLLDLEDIEKGGRLLAKKRVCETKSKGDKTVFFKGNILYSKLRPYLLKILEVDSDGICTPELIPFSMYCGISNAYIISFLKSPYVDYVINSVTYGSKMPRVGTDTMTYLCVPLPPLAEQYRIVAKVERLMAEIDELEKVENELHALKTAFPGDMKAALLQAAMQGKLTTQCKEDGDARDLLKQIAKEKAQLIKEKKIKKEKPLPEVSEDEIPFDVPDNWVWVRLGDYCQKVTDQVASGSFATIRQNVVTYKTPNYALMVKTADFANNFTRNLTYTDKKGYDFLLNSNLFGGELILSNIGSIGKVFIVPKMDIKMTLAPNSIMLRFCSDIHLPYINLFLKSPLGYDELMEITSGTAMKKFNKTGLKTILIPLPPLAEQKRIVEKLEKLLSMCDGLTEEKLEKMLN